MKRLLSRTSMVLAAAVCTSAAQQDVTTGQAPPGAERTLTPAEQKAADLRLPTLDRSSFTPESRVPTEVTAADKNPFGETVSTRAGFTVKEPVTEERRIRELLTSMRVSGISGSPGAYRVLIGSMVLGKGDTVPPLLASQAEVLKVRDVTERDVVLEFAESEEGKGPRTIGLRVDLNPRVYSLLPGELFLKLVPLDSKGVPLLPPRKDEAAEAISGALEQEGFESLVDRKTELFNSPAAQKTDEKKEK